MRSGSFVAVSVLVIACRPTAEVATTDGGLAAGAEGRRPVGVDAAPAADAAVAVVADGRAPAEAMPLQPTSPGCPAGQTHAYVGPGCGPTAPAECRPPPPPCAQQFCTCSGYTVIGCGWLDMPFRHHGTCVDGRVEEPSRL